MMISTLEENKAGKGELGELEGRGYKLGRTRGSGKSPFSARHVSRDKKESEAIMPTMTVGASSLCILPHDLPQSCLPRTQASWLPPHFPQAPQTLPASCSYSCHCLTHQGLQPSSPSLSLCTPVTYTHLPEKPSHLASHYLLSLEYIAIF